MKKHKIYFLGKQYSYSTTKTAEERHLVWIQGRLPEIINDFETTKEEFFRIHGKADWEDIEKLGNRMKKNLESLEYLQRYVNLFQILKKDEITEEIRKHIEEIKALIDKCDDAYKTALRNQGYLHE